MKSLNHNTRSNKHLSKIILLFVTMLTFSISTFADLTPYQASYYVTFDKFSGRSSMSLVQNPTTGVYTYAAKTKPKGFAALFGKIREWSTFKVNDKKVVPETYVHKSRGDKQSILYDWPSDKANSNADGKIASLDLAGDELDLLSLQMQLMLDMKNNSLKKSYSIITDNTIKTYLITPLGEETHKLAGKTYTTLKFKQQRKGSSRHNLIWLAKDIDYALVKMHQYKGDTLRGTLELTGYKSNKVKPLTL